jgi:hypothetical protein
VKNLTEVKAKILDDPGFSPRDRVIIHTGQATDGRDHIDNLNCWCKPLVMTGQELIDTEFDG